MDRRLTRTSSQDAGQGDCKSPSPLLSVCTTFPVEIDMCVFAVHSEVHTCVFGTMLYSEVNTCVVLAQDVTWRQSVSSTIDSVSSTWRTCCPCLRVHIDTLHIHSKFYSFNHPFNPANSMRYTGADWLRPNLSHTTDPKPVWFSAGAHCMCAPPLSHVAGSFLWCLVQLALTSRRQYCE